MADNDLVEKKMCLECEGRFNNVSRWKYKEISQQSRDEGYASGKLGRRGRRLETEIDTGPALNG